MIEGCGHPQRSRDLSDCPWGSSNCHGCCESCQEICVEKYTKAAGKHAKAPLDRANDVIAVLRDGDSYPLLEVFAGLDDRQRKIVMERISDELPDARVVMG